MSLRWIFDGVVTMEYARNTKILKFNGESTYLMKCANKESVKLL